MLIFTKPPEDLMPGDVADFMTKIVSQILLYSAIIAGIMIVWGGLKIITSGGNEEQVSSGKNIVKWALIGLVVITFSYTLVNFTLKTFIVRDLQKPITPTETTQMKVEPPTTP
ncbi:hypothetical protein CO101_00885 [Candidatus Berkelbacteria bacterium CG_4_9_14_3_um_filter_39_23]|uniref:DUF5671 domain-containing protein n=2 Tax=Candidatus Berkelbacteria TaxID=1618330 RepID=A0A2M7CIL4_9BACT|nr:hypothetical protein [Candidatus Berkelbacteria bacterium]OIP05959.1 MAG: hypothetical protein AUK14_00675 [Candidatus Berkelbacteria bacterium CG2_30_39_44]PIR27920.1 MAG: hypothetical protein COV39_01890 [Candidatus Berkelbacteria bacterium CG11_big_fil_rev_8_21_14_0_20_40_23]PIV25486.1 MAG: hypothetical protein COS38_01345 [Candidatus Berkelbacteria bacterium CG03_land_8_20_14_0_80_40_36]PIX30918.1 MAG: hypothetical protein COZ62_00020 [Candidatus Berkelbacteria bacterium CG_4_8_14_3_um_f